MLTIQRHIASLPLSARPSRGERAGVRWVVQAVCGAAPTSPQPSPPRPGLSHMAVAPLSRIAGEGLGEGEECVDRSKTQPHPHPPIAGAMGPSLSRDAGEGHARPYAIALVVYRNAVDISTAMPY